MIRRALTVMSIPSYDLRPGARLWRRLLVVATVGRAVSSALVATFGGAFTTADRAGEPLIVPPGWTFAIWSDDRVERRICALGWC